MAKLDLLDTLLEDAGLLPDFDKLPFKDAHRPGADKYNSTLRRYAEEAYKWAGMYLIAGQYQRCIDPGCQFDVMPVLIGPPGCGKSTIVRESAPQPSMVGEINLGRADDKVLVEKMQWVSILEADEMKDIRWGAIESVKSLLTKRGVVVRLSYRRDPQTYYLRLIIVGTANNTASFPADEALWRRMALVYVRPAIPADEEDNEAENADDVRRYVKKNWDLSLIHI